MTEEIVPIKERREYTFVCMYTIQPGKKPVDLDSLMICSKVFRSFHICDAVLQFWSENVVAGYPGNRTDIYEVSTWMNKELDTRLTVYCVETGRIYNDGRIDHVEYIHRKTQGEKND
jgi:hypothetical protein